MSVIFQKREMQVAVLTYLIVGLLGQFKLGVKLIPDLFVAQFHTVFLSSL